MSEADFLFSVRLSGREPFDNVLGDVARTVFRQVGCTAPVVTDLVSQLGKAVASANGASDVHVQFRSQAGSCEVTVLIGAREIWRRRATDRRP